MRYVALLSVVGLALVASAYGLRDGAAAAPARSPQSVTLQVSRTFDKFLHFYRLRFTGSISSAAAGQDVTVLQQTCGYSFSTSVAAAQTRDGGFWSAEPANPIVIAPSATYRAKWQSDLSPPVVIHPAIQVFFTPWIRRGEFRAQVSVGNVQQKMSGKQVLLQRKRKDEWTTIQRARLAVGAAGGSGFSFDAIFKVPQRGWTLRARIPAKTAAPCFKTGTSEQLKS